MRSSACISGNSTSCRRSVRMASCTAYGSTIHAGILSMFSIGLAMCFSFATASSAPFSLPSHRNSCANDSSELLRRCSSSRNDIDCTSTGGFFGTIP